MLENLVHAKLVSMLAVGVGSFVVGIAPICFLSRVEDLQQKLLLSCALCFGAGVLLATSVLHMLPETWEALPEYSSLTFACGFLLLYFIDEFVHYFWGTEEEHAPQSRRHSTRSLCSGPRGERYRDHSHQIHYRPGTQSVTNICATEINPKSVFQRNTCGNPSCSSWKNSTYGALQYTPNVPSSCCNEEATFLCHGNHAQPCADSNTGLLGLLLALTVHSVLEGLAIGLQKAISEVLLVVAAVAAHKFVVGFCLGLELARVGSSVLKLMLAIFVFSSGSMLGIGIGMLTFGSKSKWASTMLPVLQGLAAGTLLYVTVSEVLPRERARWHRSSRRSAGILQLFSTLVGFAVIYLLNRYVGG